MNPEDIEELVTLDRILNDNGFTVTVYEAPAKTPVQYAFDYSYSCLGKNGALGKAFEQAGEKLVSASDGEVSPYKSQQGGLTAFFSSDEKRLDFLKAFSKAASALYTPPQPKGFQRTADGYILGAKPF